MGSLLLRVTWGAVALLAMPVAALTTIVVGRVVEVKDGDTLVLRDKSGDSHAIRLVGIDAPEKAQEFGSVATRVLKDSSLGRDATAEIRKTDRYRRKVARVIVAENDLSLHLIQVGAAWHFKKYSSEQPSDERQLYAIAQEQAQQTKVGLWAKPKPIPPWDFRDQKRSRP
jgi:endonuclease YncB( thermonuclease family)